ncbi:MAG: helix-turn-helix domain-containing protein [Candidatus Ratteibacteria bacterium]|nr:helix-turn-helix domain-containing protein [Candidatus Ratteibacteria bacterium]
MPNTSIEELLTRKEVERILKISRSQIYNFLRSGRLTAYKIGGNLRFRKEDINSLIKANPYVRRKATRPKTEESKEKIEFSGDKKAISSGRSFNKVLKISENLDLSFDNQKGIYTIGDVMEIDRQEFENENPHIIAVKLRRRFKKILPDKFSLSPDEAEDILNKMEPKFKEFARRIFIQSMQKQ